MWNLLFLGVLLPMTACSPTLTFEDPIAGSASPSPSPVVTLDAVEAPAPLQPHTYTLSGDCTPAGAEITLSATWVRAETSGTVDSTVTTSCPESGSYSETLVVDSTTPLGSLVTFEASAGDTTDTVRHFHTLQPLTNGAITASALDSDAIGGPQLYLGGAFNSVSPIPVTGIAAISPDLTPNTTSDLHALLQGAGGDINAVATSGDWIYLGGTFQQFRGESTGPLVKVNLSTGELDSDFHAAFVDYFALAPEAIDWTDYVSRLVIDESEQKLYVGGQFTNSDTASVSIFARIDLATGEIDDDYTLAINATWGTTTFQNLSKTSAMVEICASSTCKGYSQSDGSLVSTYTGSSGVSGLVALDDGTFLLGDDFSDVISSSGLGAIDPEDGSFAPWGGAAWSASLSDGTLFSLTRAGDWIYATGDFVAPDTSVIPLIRFDAASGELDTTFISQLPEEVAGLDGLVGWSVSIDEDSQTAFLLAESAESMNLFAFSTESGELQGTYGTGMDGFGTLSGALRSWFIQDQVLLAGQFFTSLGGWRVGGLARYNAETGAPDPAFNQASGSAASPDENDGFNTTVNAIALDSTNGVLYAGGSFTTYRGTANVSRIARVNLSDGSLDTDFLGAGPSYGFNNPVYSLAFDSTNNVLYAGGRFTGYRTSTYVNRIAKLDADGSLYGQFSYADAGASTDGFNSSYVYALAIDAEDGAVYAGGSFTTYRGASYVKHIAKINSTTGALDTAFAYASGTAASTDGFSATVFALSLDSTNGAIYAGGAFSSYRGANYVNRLAKIDASDGTLDTTFAYATGVAASTDGFNSSVSSLALDSENGALYAGGEFSRYRSASDNSATGMVKIDSTTGALDTSFVYPLPVNMDGPAGYANTITTLLIDSSQQQIFAGGNLDVTTGIWNLFGGYFNLLDGSPAFTDAE